MSKTKIEEKMKQKKSKIEINKTGGKVMDIYIIILLIMIYYYYIYNYFILNYSLICPIYRKVN